jgi:hypothetical protein
MTNAEVHLWYLLIHHRREAVTLEDVCWFDAFGALRAVNAAGMTEKYGKWVPGVFTARWATERWDQMRTEPAAQPVPRSLRRPRHLAKTFDTFYRGRSP